MGVSGGKEFSASTVTELAESFLKESRALPRKSVMKEHIVSIASAVPEYVLFFNALLSTSQFFQCYS
jgi:hypothetical protein